MVAGDVLGQRQLVGDGLKMHPHVVAPLPALAHIRSQAPTGSSSTPAAWAVLIAPILSDRRPVTHIRHRAIDIASSQLPTPGGYLIGYAAMTSNQTHSDYRVVA